MQACYDIDIANLNLNLLRVASEMERGIQPSIDCHMFIAVNIRIIFDPHESVHMQVMLVSHLYNLPLSMFSLDNVNLHQ